VVARQEVAKENAGFIKQIMCPFSMQKARGFVVKKWHQICFK
jgi:hypothetical protein